SSLSQNADGSLNAAQAITAALPTTSASSCDWALSNVCVVTAAGSNPTVTFLRPHGSGPYVLNLVNDTSARTWTLPATAQQACSPAVASTSTVQQFVFDGTNYKGGACNSNETPTTI